MYFEEKYEEAEQLQNDLNVIEIKYNDLSLLSINRNDISLAVGKATDGSGIIEINISMTNLIGNVLKFKIIDDIGVLEHKHIHKDNDEHKHTFNYFKEQLDILISRLNSASDKAPINNEINDLRDGILDYQSLSVEKQNAYNAYINS